MKGRNSMNCRATIGALIVSVVATASPAVAAGPLYSAAPNPPAFSMAGPDMLGTHAVMIRADRFSDSLKRAREDASTSPLLQQLVAPARFLPPLQKIAFVQRAVTS